ncbi:MAG: 2-isopropylmalate synthase [Alicyclobacillus herbarius]|uniref:2-isopropylmalate synthase n=1 Tax=Alicyclobacillus herbarius TaxID=122960 RepID=UPI0003FBBD97|nr:2-isopropylmalate synthase [Alicyclobacillus herbarius]MCL6632254.1 2-isopropylmalate synthase [Alicyclobacillus herbarius]
MRNIEVFDTTLRDGEQSAGVNLHPHEKLEIALQLEKYGVDIIEAGFPAASQGDLEAVRQIAKAVKNCSVTGLARANQKDIDAAWEALREGSQPRLHIFIATSPIHMQYKLRMKPEEVVEASVASVRYAAKRFPLIEWSAEDATRSDWDFLVHIIQQVIEAGATVINLPDTVGYTTPAEYGRLFRYIREHVPNLDGVKLSAHCHDDLGLAVANTLSAIEAGVDQIEGTINGIGERAGNTSIEEVAVALAIRKSVYDATTRLDLRQTVRTSRLVSKLTGMSVPANKAVVGANAFAHESGIHQDGVLKNTLTYEIIRPEMVGLSSNSLVLGKHSGRHAFRERCKELGLELDEERFNELFVAFKALTDKKKQVTDDDILALALDAQAEPTGPRFELEFLQVSYGSALTTTTMGLRQPDGTVVCEAATGNGSVEAIFNTIERIVASPITLLDYRIQSTTGGQDSLAEVYVRVACEDRVTSGRGIDNDVLAASAKSFLDAINRLQVPGRDKVVEVG